MQQFLNTTLNWLKVTAPLHLVFIMLMLFGNNIIESDSGSVISLYLLSLSVLLIKELGYFNFNFPYRYVFIALAFINVLLSGIQPYYQAIEGSRIIFLFLMCLSGGLAIYNGYLIAPKQQWLKQNQALYVLFGLVMVSFILRVYNLDFLDSFRDEDHHLKSARMLLAENCFDYKRGLIVTYLSTFTIWLAGAETYHDFLYWGRFPSTIIGSLICIPIYFIGKKVSRFTGLFAAFLWAFSPWAIGISQNLREHVYFVFLVTSMIGLLIYMLDWFADDWKKHWKRIAVSSIVIAVIIFYAFFIDWFSTLKISGVVLAVIVFVYFLIHLDVLLKLLKGNRFLVPLMVLVALALFIPVTESKFLNLVAKTDIRWSNTFLWPSAQTPIHWWSSVYSDHYLVYTLMGIAACCSLLLYKRYWWLFSLTFVFMLFGYSYFFNRFYAPRYVVFIYPLFILSIAFAFGGLVRFIHECSKNSKLKWVATLLAVVLFIPLLQLGNIKMAITQPTKLPNNAIATTGLVHYDKKVAIDFFKKIDQKKLSDGVVITSIYDNCLPHALPHIGWVEKYKYKDKQRFETVRTIMEANAYGWMVLDEQRNGNWARGYPKALNKLFTVGNANVTCVLNNDMCQIYEWQTNLFGNTPILTEYADSNFIEYPERIDIAKPFSISFLFKSDSLITAPILTIGQIDGNSIALIPDVLKTGIDVFYGATNKVEKPNNLLCDGQIHEVKFYQFGGTRGSHYGLLVDGQKVINSNVPIHKNGLMQLYINNNLNGTISNITISTLLDKNLLY